MYVHIVKGQKISEDFLLFFNPSKKPTKMFPHFCPSPNKVVESKKFCYVKLPLITE